MILKQEDVEIVGRELVLRDGPGLLHEAEALDRGSIGGGKSERE